MESQIETSQSKKEKTANKLVSAEAAAAVRKKETLHLARAHLQQQMHLSQHPRRLEMLQNALAELERKIEELNVAGSD